MIHLKIIIHHKILFVFMQEECSICDRKDRDKYLKRFFIDLEEEECSEIWILVIRNG